MSVPLTADASQIADSPQVGDSASTPLAKRFVNLLPGIVLLAWSAMQVSSLSNSSPPTARRTTWCCRILSMFCGLS